jgi:6-phosphogluconolactonase
MASFNGNQAATYRLNADLTVTNEAATVIATDKNPHSLLTDASDRFVYIPNMGGNLVQQFNFDKETGALNPMRLPAVTAAAGDGPRHLVFHPIKPWLFVVNETGSTVTSYRHDPLHGGITAIERYTTLPADFKGKNTTADIHVTADGKFLYASNRGHDSIASYAIEENTGKLRPLGQTPTEKTPRAFEIDPSGNFLIAAGQSSHQVAVYRVDRKGGGLTPLKVYPTGKSPAWVLMRQGE